MRPGDAERINMATKELWEENGRNWLRTLDIFDDDELNQFEQNLKADLKTLLDLTEYRIKVGSGFLVFQSAKAHPGGTDYVCVRNADNTEIAYWDVAEWTENPTGVMGAIMGALCSLCGPNDIL